jgi:two-component system chemotaxis response regulator CheY
VSGERINVLIVDDMPEIRGVIRHFVDRLLHARIREAGDGLEAMRCVVEEMPALVFCDLNMPVMTGFEFLGFFRLQRQTQACTVVVLTTEDDEQTRAQAGMLTADAFLRKPFQPEEVRALLASVVPQRFLRDEAAPPPAACPPSP